MLNNPGRARVHILLIASGAHGAERRSRLRLVERTRAPRCATARDVGKVSADQAAVRSVYAHEIHLQRVGSGAAFGSLPVARRALVAAGAGGVSLRRRAQPGALTRHPRAESQPRLQEALAKPAVRRAHQPAGGGARRGNLPLLPPATPRASGPGRHRHRPAHRARGTGLEWSVPSPAQAAVGNGAGLRLRSAPVVRPPQAAIRRGARQSFAAARVQCADPTFLGGQGAGLPADQRADRDGPSPRRRPLRFRALRVSCWAGNLLLLWPLEPTDVQRGLPQRTSRFPIYRGLTLGRAARARSRVLRLVV